MEQIQLKKSDLQAQAVISTATLITAGTAYYIAKKHFPEHTHLATMSGAVLAPLLLLYLFKSKKTSG